MANTFKGLMVVIALAMLAQPVFAVTSPDDSEVDFSNISSTSILANVLLRAAVIGKKEGLSEPKKKLGTDLLRLIDNGFLLPNQSRAQVVSQMKGLKQFVAKSDSVKTIDKRVANKAHNDLVYVYVSLNSTAQTSTIDSLVWEVTDRDEKNHLAVALVETSRLEALASLSGVRSISSVLPPVTNSGSVVTEGDIIHQTDDVRSTYSQGGAGIKIGVISDGVDNIASSQSSGDLPTGVTILDNSIWGDEGTAMLEIIYDMVPDAELYFHTGFLNSVLFNNAVDDLVAAGVDVIVDDLGFFDQPYFEDGTIASHVASVLANNNIIYVSSAGNSAQKHYQGIFNDNGNGLHDFSAGLNQVLVVNVPNGGVVTPVLQWNDSFGTSGNDYDLFLFDQNAEVLLSNSVDEQNGNDNPFEATSFTNTTGSTITVGIYVNKFSGVAKTLELFLLTSNGSVVSQANLTSTDSVFGHPAVPDVIAVGAIAANDLGNDTIESFSSLGPVTIIGQGQRAKPDISGIDGVAVTGAGGFSNPFYGTSAAAPHIAAVVAQLWGQYPLATGNQIKDQLLNSAVDLGAAGTDTTFGHGRADSLLNFQAGPTITSFDFAGLTPAVTGAIDNTNHTIALTVPFGTSVTAIVPTIAITGESVSPLSGVAQDFTATSTYTVTTASGIAQAYAVAVSVASATTHTISGTVKYYDGIKAVPGALVTLSNASTSAVIATTTTSATGTYQFTGVASGGNYLIAASKSDDVAFNDVNVLDLTKTRRNIAEIEVFDQLFKKIAADVNNDLSISIFDLIKIRRYIAEIDILPSGAWKFYSSDATLTTGNYLTTGLTRNIFNATVDTSGQDFIGIKMGDVNNSWTSS